MNRESTSDDSVILAPHGKPPPANSGAALLPCSRCGTPTLPGTLATYGARCYGCYLDLLRDPQPSPRAMGDKRVGGPKAWAHALQRREQSGERLSPAQAEMWRAALGAISSDGGETA